MTNRYDGKCSKCGGHVPAGTGALEKKNGNWIVSHVKCPASAGIAESDISAKSSGFGIGEAGQVAPERDPYETADQQKRAMKTGHLECHYCGCPAKSFDFFGAPVCEDCGG